MTTSGTTVGKFQCPTKAFGDNKPQKIATPIKLAATMAASARLMARIVEDALLNGNNPMLARDMEVFKEFLIHDISPKEFADQYAQTVVYGLFASHLQSESHSGAKQHSSFLWKLLQGTTSYCCDKNIASIVDDLAEAFRATDIKSVLKGIGQSSLQSDPLIHFYEDFLSQYDPRLRKSRGVWYTPMPIVKFIVQAVDGILKADFGLPDGMADTSKVRIKIDAQGHKEQREVHKAQILDPSTGTGTFLAEAARHIYEQYKSQGGMWQAYVEQHLIPRLNGFEILMAPYAMAHLKLDRFLAETGYQHKSSQRLRIYLTNSLEEHHPDTGTLFAQFLANEAREANSVKKDCPVMVVMGNPPYSISTSNKGEWIIRLIQDYKKGLNEKNIQPLSDDYIKFIRLGQHYIEMNGEGILAYISNNSFIDGLIHRQMRKNLLEAFDKIYILDLHGNAKRKETAPDGGKDDNVFDIQQGVSINIFVKTAPKPKTKKLARVFHCDLWGRREDKYAFLLNNTLDAVQWQELASVADDYFFMPKDFESKTEYEAGFRVDELFPLNSSGVKTHDDDNLVGFSPFAENNQSYAYRPFDIRYIHYDLKKVQRHRYSVMKHFIQRDNYGLTLMRGFTGTSKFSTVFLSKYLVDINFYGYQSYSFLLFLYSDQDIHARTPNLNPAILAKISKAIALEFEPEKTSAKNKFAPIDLLDYVYAVLHSPAYRDKYKEFLKIDFPRIPYPADAKEFHRLAKMGGELRLLHLMEHPALHKVIQEYPFPMAGNSIVDKTKWEPCKDGKTGKVWINADQYFDKTPLVAWQFYIGGYQPAQKWLKDRKGRTLTFEDIRHYQRIIKALALTNGIITKIDQPN